MNTWNPDQTNQHDPVETDFLSTWGLLIFLGFIGLCIGAIVVHELVELVAILGKAL